MTAVRVGLAALAAALLGALGWLTNWGQDLTVDPESLRAKTASKTDIGTLLPDFKLSAESNVYSQISERPLLNPTRRPAPTQAIVAAPEPPRPQIRRGLYQLVGVSDFGALKVAQIKEVSSGKVRSVKVGDQLQELNVKSIGADEIVLAFQGETDVLQLAKFTASGRVPQPAPPPPAVAAAGVPPGQVPPPVAVNPAMPNQVPPPLPQRVPPPVAAAGATDNLPPGAVRNVRTGEIIMPTPPREVVNSTELPANPRRRFPRDGTGQ